VNTAIVSPSGTSAGIGFAVPVDVVNQYAPELIRTGRIERAGLGINIVPDAVARELGVEQGVLIRDVIEGGAAAAAGLQGTFQDDERIVLGDVITAIDGRSIDRTSDLLKALDGRRVGEDVELTLDRRGKTLTVRVRLQPL
jgi:S1-C subfamily serine protease